MQFLIGYYAGLQTVVEVGLGSFLHAFRIPFSGHALSLNQTLLLTLAIKKIESRHQSFATVNGIAVVAAVLKSLSPIGKKLTPMLAITMQGFLFSLGVLFFGCNFIGVLIGASLLSVWSFIQPLLLAYLFFGEKFFFAIQSLWTDLSQKLGLPEEWGYWLLIALVIFKVFLSCCVGFLGWKFHKLVSEKYLQRLASFQESTPFKVNRTARNSSAVQGAFKDLFTPWMIASILLTIGFMGFTEKSSYLTVFIYSLRVLAVAWLAFWVIRAFPQTWLQKLVSRFPSLKKALDHALVEVEPKR